jgi:DNA-binding MarR family transcriptional regulator
MTGPGPMEQTRMDAWAGFVQAHAQIMTTLAEELDLAAQISLKTYDVLVQLSKAGGALRLRDLVDRLIISQPGLSRRVERLAVEGLVERIPDPHDGRGVVVLISRAGRSALRAAAEVHMAGVDRAFAQRITDGEAAVLAAVFDRLSKTT